MFADQILGIFEDLLTCDISEDDIRCMGEDDNRPGMNIERCLPCCISARSGELGEIVITAFDESE